MNGLSRQTKTDRRRVTGPPGSRFAPAAWFFLLMVMGCNTLPSSAPTATSPQAAGGVSGVSGDTTTAANPNGPLRGLLARRRNYLTDLQQRADAQTRLAAEQERRLDQLYDLQRSNERQLAEYQQRENRARAQSMQERMRRDQQMASRARQVIGEYDQLDRRATSLDRDNQQMHARLAQIDQRNRLLQDQNNLLRRRLEDTNQQLAAAVDTNKENAAQLRTLTASARRRSGASITANNSLRRNLTAVSVPGLSIRQDGELVRIELPTDRIFEANTVRLRSDAMPLLDQVASVALQNYSRHVIGIEAHTDTSPISGTMWRSPHQLTAAQAMVVFEQLSNRHRLLPQQMFVLGHGANYPLASNATQAGQARNRRVEIVIYPEEVGARR